MNSFLGVNPVFSWWAIAAASFILYGFCAYKEIVRKQKFLAARLVALTFMMIAVMGIFLRPYLLSNEAPPPAMLLTDGYDKQKADSIVNAFPSARLFAPTKPVPYNDATTIHVNEVGTIENLRFILGNGLPADALQLLPSSGFYFFPQVASRGITQIYVPKTIRPHDLTTIHGTANVGRSSSIKLVGPGGPEDSTQVNSNTGEFSLHFRPRQTGLFLYSVILKDDSNIQTSQVPVEVKPEQKLKILFLQKFPTAETRALKNYLTEKGHAVALRYQVSKTNFNYEYSNLPLQTLNRLTPELLASFDLLFLDNNMFEETGTSEKNIITQSIRNGLGVIFFADGLTGRNNTLNALLPIKGVKTPTDTVQLRLESTRTYAFPAIAIDLTPTPDLQQVMQSRNRILSGYIYSGSGKIGFQLLRETYRLRLEGNTDDYAVVWRELIERIARMKPTKFKIAMKSTFPNTVNESVSVDILSDGTEPILLADHTFVPLEEDVFLDDVWHAKIWPTTPGWHAFKVKNDSTMLNYYVSDTTDWKVVRQIRQLQINKFRAGEPSTSASNAIKTKDIHALIWYMLFLVSAGFLWLAPKL